MANKTSARIKRMTVSAMLIALGVLFLWLGSLLDVLDLSTAALAAILVVYAVLELGGLYPFALWLGTSFLGLLLLPQKSPALAYALFAGYYPALKATLEKHLSRLLAWVLKFSAFALSVGAFLLLLKLFFPGSLSEYAVYSWMPPVLAALALLCFVVYDIALTRLILVYYAKLQKHFGLDKK